MAVPNVHTHGLALDARDNLYGEHLWYEGDVGLTRLVTFPSGEIRFHVAVRVIGRVHILRGGFRAAVVGDESSARAAHPVADGAENARAVTQEQRLDRAQRPAYRVHHW